MGSPISLSLQNNNILRIHRITKMKVIAVFSICCFAISHANLFDELANAATQEVGAYLCNGPYSQICANYEKCCETKYEAPGKYMCCARNNICTYFNGENGGKTCCCP